jgi:molybdopterin biosynthesis enzyme MoaB
MQTRDMRERALLIVNPAAGKRHAEDGDLAECVRLFTAAGFDIDRRETGTDGPTSADLAETALAEGFRVVLVAGGDGTVRSGRDRTSRDGRDPRDPPLRQLHEHRERPRDPAHAH